MLKIFKHKPLLMGGACLACTVTAASGVFAAPLVNQLVEGVHYQLPNLNYDTLVSRANQQLQQVLNDNIAEYLPPELAPVARTSIGDALGVLGFLSPNDLTQAINQELNRQPQSDVTQPVPSSTATAVSHQVNRDLLDQQIETILGKEAQQITQQKQDIASSAVTNTQQLAVDAQAALSTQEAIKAMAQQQANSSVLMGAVHAELIESRQDTATQSLMLGDISETLDQKLSARQAERRGEAITGLRQAAAARLF